MLRPAELQPNQAIACPGLFYAVSAQDGTIARIRTPGGRLTSRQSQIVADLAEDLSSDSGGYIQITNRANLQIRSIQGRLSAAVLAMLQQSGLAAQPSVDHLRNIMASPTAGIDPAALYDPQPLLAELDDYLSSHIELAGLSAKFSIGIDGGELLSVRDRPNDIWLVAEDDLLRLYLNIQSGKDWDTGLLLRPQDAVPLVAAIAQVYLEQLHRMPPSDKKPRLRQVLQHFGMNWYLEQVIKRLTLPIRRLQPRSAPADRSLTSYKHIGVQAQRQPGYSYIGVVLPLGWLAAQQLKALADLADRYGSGTIRLTPWQNLLIPDVANSQIAKLQSEIAGLGLSTAATHPFSGMVACTGNVGCAAAATNTRQDALTLAAYLEQLQLDHPINIHFSGCAKSCAQHYQSDIALLGITGNQEEPSETYQLYVGGQTVSQQTESQQPFGQLLYDAISPAEIPELVERLLHIYQTYRNTAEESFGEFVEKYSPESLKQLIATSMLKQDNG